MAAFEEGQEVGFAAARREFTRDPPPPIAIQEGGAVAATGGVARAERDSSFVGGLPPAVLTSLAIIPLYPHYPYDTEPRIVADFLHQVGRLHVHQTQT